MARNIRWFSNFKSLNGTSCTINIYDNDWPAGVTKGVRAAADPFFFEEDDSDDLLNDVVRYRTGYIRLVEQNAFGDLADIYPTGIFDRYVEVLYGGTVVFNGYIQVQDFDSEQVPVPRVLEFPVISPMGLFNQRTFTNSSNTLYMPPSAASLGSLLDVILASFTSYSYVYIPYNYGYPNPVGLGLNVSTLVVRPWNDDYHHSMTIAPSHKVMKGETYEYLIEGICKAFGWICHDTPDALVFTAFDFKGDYVRYPVGHVGDNDYADTIGIPSTASDLTTYFTPADDAANETTLQPDTGIEIDYDGDLNNREFSFDRTYTDGVITAPGMTQYDPDEVWSLCNLVPVPNLWEIDITTVMSFDNNDKLVGGRGVVAWNGKVGVMLSMVSWQSGTELFKVRFYMRRRSNQSYNITYQMKGIQSGSLGQLANSPSDIDEQYIYTTISTANDYYVQVSFWYRWGGSNLPQLPTQALIFISDINIEVYEDNLPYSEYRYKPAGDSDIIGPDGDTGTLQSGDVNPAVSSSITMPISLYRLNDHLIGNSVRTEKVSLYPYLFLPRKQLVSRFRMASALTYQYMRLMSYMNKKWRIIAQKFSPWDDKMTLTMQNSSIL